MLRIKNVEISKPFPWNLWPRMRTGGIKQLLGAPQMKGQVPKIDLETQSRECHNKILYNMSTTHNAVFIL